MKHFWRGVILVGRGTIVLWMMVMGWIEGAFLAMIPYLVVAPRVAQRCLWFDSDILNIGEELVALLLTGLASLMMGIAWLGLLGHTVSMVSLLVWTICVVWIGSMLTVMSRGGEQRTNNR